jgi:hypothetical protein
MFDALRRTVDEEDRNGGGDDIDHADQRFPRNAAGPSPGEGQQHRCEQRERQRISISGGVLSRMTEHECDRRADGGDLRERQVNEDDFAGEDLDAEIGVDTDEAGRYQECRPKKYDRLAHCADAAALRASTSRSNSEIKSSV